MGRTIERLRDEIVQLLPRLRRFARTIARTPHDADDLVQATVERALLHSDQLRPDSRLESWMFGIMRNAWIDEVRARVRRERVFAPEEAGAHVGEGHDDPQVDALSIQSALQQLPEEQRMAIGLVLVEGLSYKEAAAVMEVPIGTLTSRLARGREALAALLSPPSPRRE
ncbi:MAG: sigma-70 family RNA polymerase sigma factor [Gemmatimonadetes bacterium]|nr:sigma-70 family RNA polymerase sigma factor [Gemmatimonadota bacterium]